MMVHGLRWACHMQAKTHSGLPGCNSRSAAPAVSEMMEDQLPGLAAVGGAIDAALRVGGEGIAQGGDVDDVGIRGMDADGGDLADVAQADEGPGLAGVGGLVDAAADGDVAADFGGAGAGVDHVRDRRARLRWRPWSATAK